MKGIRPFRGAMKIKTLLLPVVAWSASEISLMVGEIWADGHDRAPSAVQAGAHLVSHHRRPDWPLPMIFRMRLVNAETMAGSHLSSMLKTKI